LAGAAWLIGLSGVCLRPRLRVDPRAAGALASGPCL